MSWVGGVAGSAGGKHRYGQERELVLDGESETHGSINLGEEALHIGGRGKNKSHKI